MNDTADARASGDLVALIRQQAAGEIAELRRGAAERADRVRRTAAAECEALRAAARALGEARGRHAAAQRIAVAESEARREWLWSRERLIEAVLALACQRLAAFPDAPDASSILQALIAEALRVLPPGPVCVRMPPGYAVLLDAAAGALLGGECWRVAVSTDDAPAAGVIVESGDGRLRFDNSFAARIQRGGHRLRRAVLDGLLGTEVPEW